MVARKNTRFDIGDWVAHYHHGIGKIKGLVKKVMDGDKQTFYKVSTQEMDYWIPIEEEDADHIKPIRSKKDFENALKVLAQTPRPIAKHHKSRKKIIHERWLKGSLPSRAALLRDLYAHAQLKKLNFNEKEIFSKVRKFFVNEWIITDPTLTHQLAQSRIDEALNESIGKAKQQLWGK